MLEASPCLQDGRWPCCTHREHRVGLGGGERQLAGDELLERFGGQLQVVGRRRCSTTGKRRQSSDRTAAEVVGKAVSRSNSPQSSKAVYESVSGAHPADCSSLNVATPASFDALAAQVLSRVLSRLRLGGASAASALAPSFAAFIISPRWPYACSATREHGGVVREERRCLSQTRNTAVLPEEKGAVFRKQESVCLAASPA